MFEYGENRGRILIQIHLFNLIKLFMTRSVNKKETIYTSQNKLRSRSSISIFNFGKISHRIEYIFFVNK